MSATALERMDPETSPPVAKPDSPPAMETANEGSDHPQLETEEIARLAYSYWEARGCQDGSAEEDWFRAEQELRERA